MAVYTSNGVAKGLGGGRSPQTQILAHLGIVQNQGGKWGDRGPLI